jgi:DNA-binding transcriptional regulator YdaS (Cro superfamily)
MDLKAYLKTLSLPERAAFAERCGTSLGHLNNIAYGLRTCAEQLAMAIEEYSGGAVAVETLRPDLIERWRYIRGTAKRLCQNPSSEAA